MSDRDQRIKKLARLPKRNMFTLSLYGLALSMTASVLDPSVYTAKVNQLLSDDSWRNTVLGLITFAGLVVAAISQPVWGALSDRCTLRWGRRRPFLVGGTLANLVLFILVALVGNVWLLGLVILSLQLSSNAVQGAYQSLIPDHVPPEQRGIASGVKSLVELPSVVIGPLLTAVILGSSAGSVTGKVLTIVGVLQASYIFVSLVTLWCVQDSPSFLFNPGLSVQSTIRDTFRVDWQGNRDLCWWLFNRFLFLFALLSLRSFLINYAEQVIGLSAEEAQRSIGLLSAVLGIVTFLVVLPSGYLADRVGRRPLLIFSGGAAAAGAFLMMLARSLPLMFGAGIFIGLGAGLFFTSSWALATDLVPEDEAARYLGITNLATAGGSAAARLTGPIVDGINHLFDSKVLGYVSVYVLAGLFLILSSWAISQVSRN